jgi:hypothetical protein
VSAATPLASNVTVTGAGGASVLVVVYNFADPGGWTGNCVFSNKNGGATSLTDQNIVIENLAFDASALGSTGAQAGAFHHIRMRMAKGVIVRGCSFAYGGDAVACRACANVQVINNTARSFTNCAWDFWEACTNVQVIGNYAESAKSNQFLNFNSIDQSTDVNMHADDCVVSGNVFNCTGTGSAVLVEPLGTSSTNSVKNVVVSGNVFKRVELACRGNVDGLMISGNTFSDYTGNVSAIFCYPFYGGTPGSVQVCGNNFNNIHITNAFGVIRVEANSVVIVGNFIDGMGPSDGPCIYTGTCTGAVVSGNYLSNGGVVAPQSVTSSHNIFASHGKTFGTYDSAGKPLELTCQSDDNLVWWGTNSVGGQRLIMDMYQRSDTSLLFLGPEVAIATNEGNHVRVQGAAAGAAPGNSPIIYPFGADTNIPLRIGGHGNSGALLAVSTSGVPPTTSDISNNFLGIWHNTTDGSVKLYANIAGIMKSVALT